MTSTDLLDLLARDGAYAVQHGLGAYFVIVPGRDAERFDVGLLNHLEDDKLVERHEGPEPEYRITAQGRIRLRQGA